MMPSPTNPTFIDVLRREKRRIVSVLSRNRCGIRPAVLVVERLRRHAQDARGRCRPQRMSRPSPCSAARRLRRARIPIGLPAALRRCENTCVIASCTSGCVGIAEVAEGRGEVGRTDEQSVDAVHRGDGRRRLDAGAAFDLHHHRDVVVDDLEVVGHRCRSDCCAGTPRRRARRPADSASRPRRAALRPRFRRTGTRKLWNPASSSRLITTVSFHGGRTTGALDAVLERHQLRHQREHVVGRVLGVEQDPVEAGHAEHFGGDRASQRRPAADQAFAGDQVAGGSDSGNAVWRVWVSRGVSSIRWGASAHVQRTRHGRLGSNFQFGIRYCIAIASSRAPRPCCW